MLVLTRKSNQSIMIGDDIEVSVLSIMGEKVRIGIQAPRDIPVFRKEVYLEIQQENVAAGASARAEVDDALKRLGTRSKAGIPAAHPIIRPQARQLTGSARSTASGTSRSSRRPRFRAARARAARSASSRGGGVRSAWRSRSRRSARLRSFSRRSRSSSISSKKASSISAMLWRMRMGKKSNIQAAVTRSAGHVQPAGAGGAPALGLLLVHHAHRAAASCRARSPRWRARSATRARSSARSTSCASTSAASRAT